jgi:hypothetical protein
MRPHLIVCYVDLHSKETGHSGYVADVVDLFEEADLIECSFTFLSKDSNPDSQATFFVSDVTNFLTDPLGIITLNQYEDDEDKYMFSSNQEDDSFKYEDDFMPVYIFFVSSYEIYQRFRKEADMLYVSEGDVFFGNFYEISFQEQMQILKKFQSQENQYDLVKKVIKTRGEKREKNLKKLIDESKN